MATAMVRFDMTAVDAAMARLIAAVSAPGFSEILQERVQVFLRAVEAGEEFLFVQRDVPVATAAGAGVVFLDPSDGLRGLMAAMGAGDV